jgi:hypothetical protein
MKFSQAEDFKRAAVFTAGKYIFWRWTWPVDMHNTLGN